MPQITPSIYFDRAKELQLRNPWYRAQVERYLLEAARSDSNNDYTSKKIIGRRLRCRAIVRTHQNGVVAGLDETLWLWRQYGINTKALVHDGGIIKRGQCLVKLAGNARALLATERTALNALQRLCGIATTTRRLDTMVGGRPIICATRKTPWGALDKRAVAWGGGYTHRLSLADGVMVKDNHLALIDHQALRSARFGRFVPELEIASISELKRAVIHYPQFTILLLDNFSPSRLRQANQWLTEQRLRRRYILEASGGITQANITQFAASGVDALSVGELTHSVAALNLSLDCLP